VSRKPGAIQNAISVVEALDSLMIAHDFLLNRERRPQTNITTD
jgi:hypothetical protein